MKSKYSVYIADDHTLFRKAMVNLLHTFEGVSDVKDAENGKELLTLIKNGPPDVAIVDLQMPIMDGSETCENIINRYPDVKIIVLTMHDSGKFILHMMEMGVHAFLLKNTEPDELETAIYSVVEKDFYHNDLVAAVLRKVDQEPTIRQLYPVAELGKPADIPTRAPQFMRLMVAPGQPVIPGADLDVRDEVMAHIFDPGDPVPKRTLTFTIEVTDEGQTTGSAFRVRRAFTNWKPIGTIVFDNAVSSYNGDAVIHFTHPTWRQDRNNPATATRVDGRKVR